MRDNKEIERDIIKALNKIRPYIQGDGGDIQYISYEDGIVSIRLLGACVGCGSLDFTLKDGIEALLVEIVPEVIEVRNVIDEVEDDLY